MRHKPRQKDRFLVRLPPLEISAVHRRYPNQYLIPLNHGSRIGCTYRLKFDLSVRRLSKSPGLLFVIAVEKIIEQVTLLRIGHLDP
jgi:hypothetical protein